MSKLVFQFLVAQLPLNNREEALLFWGLVLSVWLLSKNTVRGSVVTLLRAASRGAVVGTYLAAVAYVGLIAVFLWRIGYWNFHLTKDTALWLFGTAFVSVANSASDKGEFHIKPLVMRSLGLGAMLQFVVHLYVFPLLVELVLVPVASVMVGVAAVSRGKNEYAPAEKTAKVILATLGLVLLGYALLRVFGNFGGFASSDTARRYVLPLLFAVPFLPFVYFLAVYAAYDALFSRVDFFLRDNTDLARFAKRRILGSCLADLNKIHRFSKQCSRELITADDETAVLAVMQRFRENRAESLS